MILFRINSEHLEKIPISKKSSSIQFMIEKLPRVL